jgi:hypothetical protein
MKSQRIPPPELVNYISNLEIWRVIIAHTGEDWAVFEIVINDIINTGEDSINKFHEMFKYLLQSENKNLLKWSQWIFRITFNDFSNTTKELFEIEEVRSRVQKLISKAPYFFYFFDAYTILLLTVCSLEYRVISIWNWKFDDPSLLNDFLMLYFMKMNKVFKLTDFTLEEINLISKEILDKFWLISQIDITLI